MRLPFVMQIDKIIKGCIQKDRRSQNALYKAYYPLLHNIACRYSSSDGQIGHLINGGFYKVLKNIKSYNSDHAIATWIRNIAVNNCIDEYRRNASYQSNTLITDCADYMQSIDINEGEQALEEKDVLNLLKELPEINRNVFNLFVIDGFSHKEIAKLLVISDGVSRWHLNQARKMLIKLIEQRQKKEQRITSVS